MSIKERIKKVLSLVFEVEINSLNDESSPDNIDKWDSIGHINMAVALESEFNIELTEEEIMELMNLKIIELVIFEKTKSV
ncbi:MAG: acyl carrier protein [Bacteroidota bacterium]|jgi:acyl carrier protein